MRTYRTYDENITIYDDETVRTWVLKENMYWWKKEMEKEREEFEDLDAEIENILVNE